MDLVIGIDAALLPEDFQEAAGFLSFKVLDWFIGPAHQIERFVFEQAGDVWTAQDIADLLAQQANGMTSAGPDTLDGSAAADLVYGNAGDDTLRGHAGADALYGDDGNDTLIGGTGDDLLVGGAGSDTYRFEPGDGNDSTVDAAETGALNTLSLGAGIDASSLSLAANGIVVHSATGVEHIRLDAFDPSADAQAIDRIEFADGSAMTMVGLLQGGVDLVGGNADDVLIGSRFGDRLDGGAGDDVMIGAEGSDEYRFAAGWGHDRVIDYGGGVNTLRFGDGISAADISASWRDGQLVLAHAAVGAGGDEIAIAWAPSEGYRIDRAVFADGTVWDGARFNALADASQAAAAAATSTGSNGTGSNGTDTNGTGDTGSPSGAGGASGAGPTPAPAPAVDPGTAPSPGPSASASGSADTAAADASSGAADTSQATPPSVPAAAPSPGADQLAALSAASPVAATPVAIASPSVAGGASLPASVSPETEKLISQFFDRIQPPPLDAQSWIDSWPATRESASGRSTQVRSIDPLPGPAAPSQGIDPGTTPVNPGPVPDEQVLTPEEIMQHNLAMHAWLDAHPVSAVDPTEGYLEGQLFGAGSPLGQGMRGGLSFGATPGFASITAPALQPLQGLREGIAILGWS